MNIATVRLMSRVLFLPVDVTVILPEEDGRPEKKYPVLWLLHGANGDHRTYLYSVNLERMVQKHRVIIVMPSALNSDYCNYQQFGTGYDFAAYFFEELMPFIYATFPASEQPQDNYIEGASMGGFGAAALGLMHPEKFAAVGMLGASLRESAFLMPYENSTSEKFREDALADPKRFPTEYGFPETGIKRKEVNVIARYRTIREFLDSPDCMWRRFPEVVERGVLPRFYVACGTEDLFYQAAERFRHLAEKLGVQEWVFFHIEEGVGHDEAFFAREIEAFLDFYEV